MQNGVKCQDRNDKEWGQEQANHAVSAVIPVLLCVNHLFSCYYFVSTSVCDIARG